MHCRGCVTVLKLSPNLRKTAPKADPRSASEPETAKLEMVMALALKGNADEGLEEGTAQPDGPVH